MSALKCYTYVNSPLSISFTLPRTLPPTDINMKYTIAIPTYNRCDILHNAIKATLDITHDDYEILVSNNSSTDKTEDVVKSFNDPRIRYIKTDKLLSMVDHWDFVLDHCRGDWIIYLPDDDGLFSYCLLYLDRVIQNHPKIELFRLTRVNYLYGGEPKMTPNSVVYPPEPNQSVDIFDGKETLKLNFSGSGKPAPAFPSACISRKFLNKIKKKYGRNFFGYAPDITSGMVQLANCGSYACINFPVGLAGKGVYSYGSGAKQNPDLLTAYYAQYEKFDNKLHYSPYPDLFVLSNCVYDMMLETKATLLTEELKDVDVHGKTIGRRIVKDLLKYIELGHYQFEKHLDQVISDFELENEFDHIKKRIQRNKAKKETLLSLALDKINLLYKKLKIIVYAFLVGIDTSQGKRITVQGKKTHPKFTNLFEATKFVESEYDQYNSLWR